MTPMSTEALIVLGLFGFHLYDALVLLHPREMVMRCTAERTALSSPYPYLTIRGRIPWLPNPLRPDRMLFRLSWSDEPRAIEGRSLVEVRALATRLRPLGALTLVTGATMLIGLPVLALRFGIGPYFLYALIGVYLLIAAMLGLTWRQRDALGLTTRDVLAIAFDALACPPFAINLMRKLGLRQTLAVDPLELAAAQLPRAEASLLWRSIKRRLDDELLQTHDDDGAARLRALYAELEGKMT